MRCYSLKRYNNIIDNKINQIKDTPPIDIIVTLTLKTKADYC